MAVDLNELNGPQRKLVRDAFLAAFTAPSLDKFLQDALNKQPLANLVAPADFDTMLFDLINVSRRNGALRPAAGSTRRVCHSHGAQPSE